MIRLGKTFALMLILVMAISSASLLMAKPANAQIPSVPIFSISTVSGTTVIPTTYSTNPYTGANTTNLGYTVNNFNITFTIQNEPSVNYFELEYKGHFSPQWSTPLSAANYNVTAFASPGSQTTITFWGNNATGPLGGPSPTNEISLYYGDHWGISVPLGSQMDFRLQAVSGETPIKILIGYEVLGNVSDWSPIQTVAIPDFSSTTVSPTPTLTPNPTLSTPVPELSWLAIVPLLLSVFAVAVIVRHRKKR